MVKKIGFLSFLMILAIPGFAQNSNLVLKGGYSFYKFTDPYGTGNGFHLNALYEESSRNGRWNYGLALGYFNLSGNVTSSWEAIYSKTNISSIPIYYSQKYLFGGEKLKAFVKGVAGFHFTNYKYTSTDPFRNDDKSKGNGFVTGFGAGLNYPISKKVFLQAEYERLYLFNDFYGTRTFNSASLGIGIKIK